MAAMTIEAIMLLVNTLLGLAFDWYEKLQGIAEGKVPSWEEISNKNARLQAKIDAEKVEIEPE